MQSLRRKSFEVVVVSPRNYFVFTPLLASTAVGTLEFRCIVEPFRYHMPDVEIYESECTAIDLQQRTISCRSVLPRSLQGEPESFKLTYDHLLLACGGRSNTFGIKGVHEHAYFLKDIGDSRKIRGRVIECPFFFHQRYYL